MNTIKRLYASIKEGLFCGFGVGFIAWAWGGGVMGLPGFLTVSTAASLIATFVTFFEDKGI